MAAISDISVSLSWSACWAAAITIRRIIEA
jgi:hypothetical protein